jgi:hypothetical protein
MLFGMLFKWHSANWQRTSLWTLRIAAGYMVLIGIAGLVLPLFPREPNQRDFQAQSFAYRLGRHIGQFGLPAAEVIAGFSLFWHHAWARNLALALLVIGSFFNARDFAWGFSGAKEARPTLRLYLVSGTVVAAWNAFWFYLIYRVAL